MASLYLSVNKIFADKSEPWFLPRYPFPFFRDLPSSSNRKTCKGTWERCSRGAVSLKLKPRSKCVTSNTQASEFWHLIQALKSFPLSTLHVSAYKRTKNRAILVDYYGIMVQPGSIRTTSSNETIQTLKSLFSDPKNIVFLVNGKDRKTLTEWFSSCDDLGLAAVAEIFACTVGQKPRKAKYYLDETAEIVKMLEGLATSTAAISDQTASTTDVPTKIL
ncbi:unnamed protein product [Brassica oleracea var. botrytis]|uniref:(rape) hypothetical protein n=1 Tax=Brassica napus TaxID=3708 RepID=A0A816R9H7_BRANA|nr:unnamed protein product [Brassica napus]